MGGRPFSTRPCQDLYLRASRKPWGRTRSSPRGRVTCSSRPRGEGGVLPAVLPANHDILASKNSFWLLSLFVYLYCHDTNTILITNTIYLILTAKESRAWLLELFIAALCAQLKGLQATTLPMNGASSSKTKRTRPAWTSLPTSSRRLFWRRRAHPAAE